MSSPAPTTSLAAKLARVYLAVQRVPKSGRHPQGWTFATEGDVADMVRAELGARGLFLSQTILAHDERPLGATKSGAPITRHTVKMRFTLHASDGAPPLEKNEAEWYGQADDASDKGLPKAITAARKSFLLSTFLISTGDEPDAHDVRPAAGDAVPAPDEFVSVRGKRWAHLMGLGLSAQDVMMVLKSLGVLSSQALEDDAVWAKAEEAVYAAAKSLGAHDTRGKESSDG